MTELSTDTWMLIQGGSILIGALLGCYFGIIAGCEKAKREMDDRGNPR